MPHPTNRSHAGGKKPSFATGIGQNPASNKKSVSGVISHSRVGKSMMTSSRSQLMSSSSKKNITTTVPPEKQMGKPPVQVFDDAGQDVTPIPMIHLDPSAVRKGQSNILADSHSGGTPTDLMSSASIYQTGTMSTYGGGPFTRSVFSTSQSERSSESIGDDVGEPSNDANYLTSDVRHRREEVKEVLTESDLDQVIDIDLTETDTIWLLDMPGICVSVEGDEAPTVKENNERYKELVRARVGNDLYTERGMNTFNNAEKFKAIQTTKIGRADQGIMATTWDMFDTFKEIEDKEAKEKEAEDEENMATESRPGSAKDAETETTGTNTAPINKSTQESRGTTMSSSNMESDSVYGSKESGVTSVPDQQAVNDAMILQCDELKRDLFVMERVINLNSYQPKQASYRDFSIIPDPHKLEEVEEDTSKQVSVADMGPNLDRLWSYNCPLTKGRNVSTMSWNKINPDLIAVGYGQFEFKNQSQKGLVCCWSLKNPEYPERIYTCDSGVTAMDFSLTNPNLLAVGLYDGTIAIFNVRSTKDDPVLDSFESEEKHISPVWQLQWIEKERGSSEERAEVLVSISTDGRVTQWSIRKGFESSDLMKLKRITPKTTVIKGKEKKGDALISRYAGGFCFDFSPKESNIYLTGTEDGHIHRCSCSYNEQYLESYHGHGGPIYRIQWSPFCHDTFLSASADWTMRLWTRDRTKSVITFHSTTKSVNDICWSPRVSTVFACVNEKAVEVWDLNQNTLDPLIQTIPTSGARLSTVSFARNSDCLLVGDSEGQVTVYQLRCMPTPPEEQTQALQKVIQSSLASQLSNKDSA